MIKFAINGAQARAARFGFCAILCLAVLSCGGGDAGVDSGGSSSGGGTTTPTGSNVVSVVVDAGPLPSTSADTNTLFTTVTVCAPGSTSKCQTIDHIQVDTGSYGLRILSSVLTLALPVETATNGEAIVECTVFADGYSWGPVALADMQVSGESASSLPIQVIGDPNYANVPGDCSSAGSDNAEDTVAEFGANGVLGIGPFAQDCGPNCAAAAQSPNYYACTASACQPTALALANQVTNPITLFATDNNGVIIQLPSVAAGGAATVTGSMIFGIDTETNNKSGNQTVLTVAGSAGGTTGQFPGQFATLFNGGTLAESFLDTGSNGLFFNDGSLTTCTDSSGNDPGITMFYCPPSIENFTATLEGQNGMSASVSFSVAPADTLAAGNTAFSNLAGTFASNTATFDWGLPFFYNRTVYTAIEGATTAVGTGPYVAF
jgi:Protein of unknown function (DUF3443)